MTNAPERARYWVVPVVRGVLALVPAVAITFTANHSVLLGLLAFGAWAVVAGLAVGALSLRLLADRTTRVFAAASAIVTVVAGLLALTVPAGLPFLLYLVSVWAAASAILELFAGLRARGSSLVARDWIAVGVLTALLAILFALVPADTVTAVGFLGVYFVIAGVYLIIGGLSLKWASPAAAPQEPAAASADAPAADAAASGSEPS